MTKGFLIDTDLEILRNGSPVITTIPDLPSALVSETGEEIFHKSLCRHSEYLHLPFVQHHGIWFNWILTKYELPSGNITDFAYLSTTSSSNTIVLIEIEDPTKKMWVGTPIKPEKSDPFVKAIEQVQRWRIDLKDPANFTQLISDFKAMMGNSAMASNTWDVKYALVYGRSNENNTTSRKKMYADLQQDGIQLLTYDNLISAHKTNGTIRRNIIKTTRPGPTFSYAYLNEDPHAEFAYLNSGKLFIPKDVKEILIAKGFDINSWEQGNLLSVNGRKDMASIYL